MTRVTRLRVRYADTDQMGVVYYANYLVWFEVARTEWLRDTGWTYREMEGEGISLPVIEARCEYRLPARYDDELDLETTGTALTGVRLRFDYRVIRVSDGSLLAEGHTIHASMGAGGRPRRLPARVGQVLAGGRPQSRAGRRDGSSISGGEAAGD